MKIVVSDSKVHSGEQAARDGAALIRAVIAQRGEANIILATGASQFEMLAELTHVADVDWHRVTAFHLDEYAGLPITHPASFRLYLWQRFMSALPLPLKERYFIEAEGDCAAECRRLNAIIRTHPIDVAFIGIGENGHLAFNDPPADFQTAEPYIVVNLDEACRRQQLGEGWFKTLEDVPKQAISMSIRQILKSRHIICTVPDERKAKAVKGAIEGPVTPQVPASILQRHEGATIYLDPPAASLLKQSVQ
ncbi:MAG TPA: glucosamine-6-phosphate deaminase [Tepidisphaeraceae bacterium]|jgi:glucosamine-6-phosphate deaminase|nr:glucosamine-6-phosphate deaminase [Tepidisphaeraceae bacterium]